MVKIESIANVILMSFDSLRSDAVENIDCTKAPIICRFRDQGAFFKNTIVQAPLTVPSHCSMLSGMYPVNTGVRDMHHKLPADAVSLFDIMKKQDILTISMATTPMLKNRGFKSIDEHINLSFKRLSKILKQNKNKRFFSFIHYWFTHTPYETVLPVRQSSDILLNLTDPLRYVNDLPVGSRLFDLSELHRVKRIRQRLKNGDPNILAAIRKGYIKSLYTADKFISRLIDTLIRLGIAEDTLLILMGDHGESFNEHDEIRRQPDGRYEHGHFLYDNILKIPLIFYLHGNRFGKKFEEQIELLDLFSTVLQSMGISYDEPVDAISLWNSITGVEEAPLKEYTFSEVVRESRNIELRSVRSPKTKIIIDYKHSKYELYNLIADPEEQNNVWPDDPNKDKDSILHELKLFSGKESKIAGDTTEEEKQKIEKALRDLGYL